MYLKKQLQKYYKFEKVLSFSLSPFIIIKKKIQNIYHSCHVNIRSKSKLRNEIHLVCLWHVMPPRLTSLHDII